MPFNTIFNHVSTFIFLKKRKKMNRKKNKMLAQFMCSFIFSTMHHVMLCCMLQVLTQLFEVTR
jgi:hypothetical protein